MVNSQQLVSEHEAVVASVNAEKAKWLGLIEEFGGRADFCLAALCAYFEKVRTNAKIYKQRHSHIYSIIHTHYTQCWLNGDSLLVYEDYALLHCHVWCIVPTLYRAPSFKATPVQLLSQSPIINNAFLEKRL